MKWNGNTRQRTRKASPKTRRRRRNSSRAGNVLRGIILETVGVIAIVAIFLLLRFEPADLPQWLFPESERQQSSVLSTRNPSDANGTDRGVGKDFGLFSWQQP